METDYFKYRLAKACFDELQELRDDYNEQTRFLISLIEDGQVASPEFITSERKIQVLQTRIEEIMNESVVPDRFWNDLVSEAVESLADSARGLTMNNISIFVPSTLSMDKIRIRGEERSKHPGGRPPHMKVFIDGIEYSKTEFAKQFDPSYAIAPETSRRMKWETVEKIAADLVATNRCFKVVFMKLGDDGDFHHFTTIGG